MDGGFTIVVFFDNLTPAYLPPTSLPYRVASKYNGYSSFPDLRNNYKFLESKALALLF